MKSLYQFLYLHHPTNPMWVFNKPFRSRYQDILAQAARYHLDNEPFVLREWCSLTQEDEVRLCELGISAYDGGVESAPLDVLNFLYFKPCNVWKG